MLVISILIAIPGCKKSPTDSIQQIESVAAGSYVGYNDLGDGFVNVWLAVLDETPESDTSGIPTLTGFIEYGNEREQLLSITTDANQDSLWLQYSYNGVIHRAASAITIQGLDLIFSTPSGLPTLRMNREVGAANMTGKWLGTMTSNYLLTTSAAVMIMDQWGGEYFGDVDVQFSSALHGDINNGSTGGSDFSLSGTGIYGSYSTTLQMEGHYVHQDTIGGNWVIGSNYDSGSFLFWRDF
jgi:hypothetical protein